MTWCASGGSAGAPSLAGQPGAAQVSPVAVALALALALALAVDPSALWPLWGHRHLETPLAGTPLATGARVSVQDAPEPFSRRGPWA